MSVLMVRAAGKNPSERSFTHLLARFQLGSFRKYASLLQLLQKLRPAHAFTNPWVWAQQSVQLIARIFHWATVQTNLEFPVPEKPANQQWRIP